MVQSSPEEARKVYQRGVGVHQEPQEVRKGLQGNAVPRPRTVVVHSWDAAGAVPAVVRAGGFGVVAFFAPALVVL